MASYATPQDLADLLRQDVDTAYATLLLANASAILRGVYPWLDAKIADGSFDADLAKQAVTAMAKRAMLGAAQDGVKSEGLDGITVTYDNPMGNLYLTAVERALIEGPARVAVGSMKLRPGWTVPTGEWL